MKQGKLVCIGNYFDQLERAPGWFYPTDVKVVIQLKQVLTTDLKLEAYLMRQICQDHGQGDCHHLTNKEKVQRDRNRSEKVSKISITLGGDDPQEILDEIKWRETMD
jgi:hypothetical protein